MTAPRTMTVLLDGELLTLGRACGLLRRRNLPIREFHVDSNGPQQGGAWRLSCVIDADDATLAGLVLQLGQVVGVHGATLTPHAKAVS